MVIRVVIGESMGLLRSALCAALAGEEDVEVVAEVTGLGELPGMVRRHLPDVVLVDLASGAPEPVKVITETAPATAVLALCDRWGRGLVEEALTAGAKGLIGKDEPLHELVRAVRALAAGERVIDVAAAATALRPATGPLTPREAEVLRMAAEGLPLKEIARRLFLAHGTVRNHLSAIMRKTGARNRMEAVLLARRDGWM
ncbi:response regulator transcription factor [Micromonospora andamanensis]